MSFVLFAIAGAIGMPAFELDRARVVSDRNRRADCTSYDSEQKCLDVAPSSANCVWALRVPGADFDDRTCQAQSCDNLNTGTGADPQGECNTFGGCNWDADAYYCYSQGGKVPCTMRYPSGDDGTTCPSGCEYNEMTSGCIEKGGKVLCEVIYAGEDECKKNGCDFNDVLYKCWDKGRTIPCQEFEFYSQANCPSYCQYVDTGGKPTEGDGKCVTKGSVTACEEYFSEDECPKDRCKFYPEPLERCWAIDKEIPCSDLNTVESCDPSKTCQWHKSTDAVDDFEGYCGKCHTTDCSQAVPTGGGGSNSGGGNDEPDCTNPQGCGIPDDGKPCADHNGEEMDGDDFVMCPEPRCTEDYGGGGAAGDSNMCGSYSGSTCRDAKCEDHMYDQVSCAKQSGCTFEPQSNICYETNGVFPCDESYQNSDCPASYCDWKAAPTDSNGNSEGDGFCVLKGTEPTCTRYSGGSGETCEQQSEGSSDDQKCVWIDALETCVTKAKAEDLPCTSYNQDPDLCPSPKCALLNGICWKAGEELPCNAVCSAASCLGTGKCAWNTQGNGMGTCTECKASGCPAVKDCTTYKDEETCPETHCTFEFNEDGGGGGDDIMDDDTGGGGGGPGMGGGMGGGGGGGGPAGPAGECVDHQCVGMYEASECSSSALGCDWDNVNSRCWPSAFDPPCNEIWDKTGCTAAGCEYDSTAYECKEKGQKAYCRMQYDEADCNALGYCEYDSNYNCNEKASNMPSTPPPLTGAGDGSGNEDYTKCTSTMYDEVKAKLEAADTECVIHDRTRARRGNAVDQQLECLAYFLEQSPNPTTVAKACPCLWAWSIEINPGMDHWMKIKC